MKTCNIHLYGRPPDYPMRKTYQADCQRCENDVKAGRLSRSDPPPMSVADWRRWRMEHNKGAKQSAIAAAIERQKQGWSKP